jgi:cell division protein FtsB
MEPELIFEPLVEHGFMGLSAVLLAVLIWLLKKLLSLLESNNAVLAEHTQALRSLDLRNTELVRLTGDMRDRLLCHTFAAER